MSALTENSPEISVVVPVYNERENLEPLVASIHGVVKGLGRSWELILVDDGSTDGSLEGLARLQAVHPFLRVLKLKRNEGQSAALDAGFRHARGRVVVTLDGDLQNDPADIPMLLAHLERHDAAVGWRQRRQDPWLKRVSSRIANAVRNRVTGDSIRDTGCGLKAFRRECLEALKLYHGMHRFLPTLLRLEGYSVVEVPVAHRPRRAGVSKYTTGNRIGKALVDLVAVRWMKARILRYEVEEITGRPPASDD